ncbi:MAG: DUF134 domain-containing protein [Candidatus Peregrinibacteria bacterium]
MPRPRRIRFIGRMPQAVYFKPAGIKMRQLNEVILSIEEFEAIRLKDFKNLSQKDSAKRMGISQPTFHRLIFVARKKAADAIINGKALKIEGGNFKKY